MRIERVDPAAVDLETAAEMAAIVNAGRLVDGTHLSPTTPLHEQLYAHYGWENRPPDVALLARDEGGRIVGRVYVELPMHDNLAIGVVDLDLHPDIRTVELADELLAAGLDEIEAVGRSQVISNAWASGFWFDFMTSRGFEVGARAAQRRLWMSRLDWPTLDRLHADSLQASAAYDVIEVPNPAPDDLMAGLVELHRAMNDAPVDDLDVEDEVWDVDRARAYESAMRNRRIQVIRLVAVRRADGVLGGFTVMCIEDERPTLGFQEDTGVVGEHRGHRLGLRLKIEMLRLLRDRHPAVEPVDTWNAESNAPMIAVNDALGCVVVAQGVDLQRPLRPA